VSSQFQFRKSRHSGGNAGQECVEVAVNVAGVVAVRDSKKPARGYVRCTPAQWEAFTEALVREG
jgi:hypothetical protein